MCLDFLQAASHAIEEPPPGQFNLGWGQLGFPPEVQTNSINSDGAWNKGGVCGVHMSQGCSLCPKTLLEVLEAFALQKERIELTFPQM